MAGNWNLMRGRRIVTKSETGNKSQDVNEPDVELTEAVTSKRIIKSNLQRDAMIPNQTMNDRERRKHCKRERGEVMSDATKRLEMHA